MNRRSSRQSKNKPINPTFFVFCEGETEEALMKHLRSKYRLPIEIHHKIAGCDISDRYIASYKRKFQTHSKDRTYLLYDLDKDDIVEKLKTAKATLIGSNPCIELWFLLHYCSQNSVITAADCIKKLKTNLRCYKKGVVDENLKKKMAECHSEAAGRAKKLNWSENPSTNMHRIIEDLECVKEIKMRD